MQKKQHKDQHVYIKYKKGGFFYLQNLDSPANTNHRQIKRKTYKDVGHIRYLNELESSSAWATSPNQHVTWWGNFYIFILFVLDLFLL